MKQDQAIHLSTRDRDRLRRILEHGTEGATALRATVILLSGLGHSSSTISDALRVTEREVRNCRRRWRSGGLSALQDGARSGRPPLADKAYIRLLRRTAKKDPHTMGYVFSRWTTPRLSTYMFEKTGIKLSPDYIGKLLRSHNLAWGKGKLTTENLVDKEEKKTCREMAKKAAKGFEITSIQF
jgi:transposase